jgi:hypothetical protein
VYRTLPAFPDQGTAMFGVNAVLLAPLPFAQPNNLVARSNSPIG